MSLKIGMGSICETKTKVTAVTVLVVYQLWAFCWHFSAIFWHSVNKNERIIYNGIVCCKMPETAAMGKPVFKNWYGSICEVKAKQW
jgi:hypothetical protein